VTPPQYPYSDPPSRLERYLAVDELDELAALHDDADFTSPAETATIARVLESQSDVRAAANLLMYPDVIPADLRVAAALRAVAPAANGYLRIAGAVAISHLPGLGYPDEARADLLAGLLGVVSTDAGPAAVRAASAIGSFLDPGSIPDVVAMLIHPNPSVRRNLAAALAPFVGPAGLDGMVREVQQAHPDSAVGVRERLAADGIDLHGPLRLLPVVPYLPNYREWANSYLSTAADI
jgi:hypothetical protein